MISKQSISFQVAAAAIFFYNSGIVQADHVISGPEETVVGELAIFKADLPEGAAGSWLFSPATKNFFPVNKELAVFSSHEPGTYTVTYGFYDKKANELIFEQHILVVHPNGPDPDPVPIPPGPDPKPIPEALKRVLSTYLPSATADLAIKNQLIQIYRENAQKAINGQFTTPEALFSATARQIQNLLPDNHPNINKWSTFFDHLADDYLNIIVMESMEEHIYQWQLIANALQIQLQKRQVTSSKRKAA